MFATIDTDGATHIAIHIPHLGVEKSLPALAAMLEQNSVFIRSGYQTADTVKPAMGITPGDKFTCANSETDIVVAESDAVIREDFVHASPETFTSNAKALKRENDENSRLPTENSFLKQEMEALKTRLAELAGEPA